MLLLLECLLIYFLYLFVYGGYMRYMVYGKIFLIGLKMKRIHNVTPLLKDNQELLAKLNDITKVSIFR